MVTAIVLINVQHGRINEIAEQLVEMDGVAEVYSVGGRFDLVAIIRVKTNEQMADLVTNRMLRIDGIEKTETLIAFKAYSKHDLERMFAIGIERA
ncbi:Lrp/AsnC ligand binding domain-containing protein [Litorilinea aerophila]|uniref:Lrp/AsnC family transcriptional regulator n=1 Tax=Litorilinea aerophila TaxID=1204385 RepID=A0A540VFZ2_9CHLR|nr:Lrp/AsnC ligand binding domain-containing protein [Litorilinea aerophila]MCC9076683.1 Lrp/AsnC ligand binding domain-containing protein [Litorilinea aerophila]OUC06736.1 AsnC family transcriptional regulator [Litorilinea aerophila]GIV77722.1 MAG: AsnC family transcriptional regulator [Litorilinea sp.]